LLQSCHSGKPIARTETPGSLETNYMPIPENSPHGKPPPSLRSSKVERESTIVTKYADILGVQKKDITNYKLYNFIDLWYATPYKYAGRTKAGVDCSDLTALLFQSVYDVTIEGNVTEIYKQCKPIKASRLKEGDLVFFKINSKSLSHVGIYLQNNKFVHASIHSGVIIDDLGENYYKKYFYVAGRLRRSFL